MKNLTTASLVFLAAGIFTSVTILSGFQVLFAIPMFYYIYKNSKEEKLPVSAWFLIAFGVIALLSLVVNYDLIPKPSKNFGRLKYFLFGVGGIYVFQNWLKLASDEIKKNVLNLFFLSIIIAGIYAFYTFRIAIDSRANGLTDTMRYGYGSGMFLIMLFSAILHRHKMPAWFNWKFAVLTFVIGFIGMYVTYTRGALLGFICGLPFALYFYSRRLGLTLGSLAVLAVITLGGIYLFGTGTSNSRFLSNKNNPSDVIRRSQWKAAVIATEEKPILGWGLSNFHSQLKRIKNDYDLDAKDYNDAHSHNLFLEISSGTGLIGLFLFLGWLISWALEMFKKGGLVRALVIPFGVAFVVSSQFEVTFDANNASMIFFIYSISSVVKKYSY